MTAEPHLHWVKNWQNYFSVGRGHFRHGRFWNLTCRASSPSQTKSQPLKFYQIFMLYRDLMVLLGSYFALGPHIQSGPICSPYPTCKDLHQIFQCNTKGIFLLLFVRAFQKMDGLLLVFCFFNIPPIYLFILHNMAGIMGKKYLINKLGFYAW